MRMDLEVCTVHGVGLVMFQNTDALLWPIIIRK